jgi:hypothetical protein
MSAQLSWLDMQPEDISKDVKHVQDALFAEPDRYGTEDLFGGWA